MSEQILMDGVLEAAPTAWAVFSPCGRYRYLLGRRVAPTGKRGLVVMVNPSNAGAYKADGKTEQSDPTIASLKKRALTWGWGSFEVVNLAGLISSEPDELLKAVDPIGPENDVHIRDAMRRADQRVVAWGLAGRRLLWYRAQSVLRKLAEIGDVFAIARSANGSPKHPQARGKNRVPEDRPIELFAPKKPQDEPQ